MSIVLFSHPRPRFRRTFEHALGTFVLSLLLVSSTQLSAANLTLLSDAPVGSPLVITPLDAGASLLLSVTNDTIADPPGEFLTAWQLRLEIVADAGATGTVDFNAATKPTGYLLDEVGHNGPIVTSSGDRLFAQDFNIPDSGGVQVPNAPGANLLSITFSPSADAQGTFGVFALDGLTNSDWREQRARWLFICKAT